MNDDIKMTTLKKKEKRSRKLLDKREAERFRVFCNERAVGTWLWDKNTPTAAHIREI